MTKCRYPRLGVHRLSRHSPPPPSPFAFPFSFYSRRAIASRSTGAAIPLTALIRSEVKVTILSRSCKCSGFTRCGGSDILQSTSIAGLYQQALLISGGCPINCYEILFPYVLCFWKAIIPYFLGTDLIRKYFLLFMSWVLFIGRIPSIRCRSQSQ